LIQEGSEKAFLHPMGVEHLNPQLAKTDIRMEKKPEWIVVALIVPRVRPVMME
jgi:hypothetical protein